MIHDERERELLNEIAALKARVAELEERDDFPTPKRVGPPDFYMNFADAKPNVASIDLKSL